MCRKIIFYSVFCLAFFPIQIFGQSKIDSISRLIHHEKDLLKKSALYLERAIQFERKDSSKAFSDVTNAMNFYKKSKNDRGIADSYITLAKIYFNYSKFNKAYYHDSLALYISEKNDYRKGRAEAFLVLGTLQKKQGKLEDAEKYFSESLSLMKENSDNSEEIIKLYSELGAVKSALGKYNEAFDALNSAIELGKKTNNRKGLIASYINYANTLTRIADYDQSIQYHLKAVRLAEEIGDSNQISKEYNNLAVVYKRLQEFKQAIYYYKKSLYLAESSQNYKSIGLASTNLAVAYAENNQLEKLDTLYAKALDAFEKEGDLMGEALVYHNYGYYLFSIKDYKKAEKQLIEALKLRRTVGAKPAIASTLSVLGNLQLEQNNLSEAEKYLSEAEKLVSGEEETIETLEELYVYLKKLYTLKGDYKKAFEYQEKELALNKKIFNENEKVNALKLQVEYDLEKKDIALKTEKEIQKRRQLYILIISGFVFLILILILIVLVQRRKRIDEKHQSELIHLQQQHRLNLADSLTQAEQEERTKIAHKLHDETAGILSVAKLNVEQLSETLFITGTEAEAKLKSTRKLLTEAGESIRNISHSLMPVTLEKLGLKAALQDLIEAINTSGKIKIEEVLEGIDETDSWNPQLSLTIYRMVQEVFNNIIKHAQATHVLLQVIELEDSVTIYIEDNGKGMSGNSSSDGIGLRLLRQNIEYLNGKVEISGQENKGTFVLAELPIIRKTNS